MPKIMIYLGIALFTDGIFKSDGIRLTLELMVELDVASLR